MTLESPLDDQLIGVSVPTDIAASVALHETMVVDGPADDAAHCAHETTDDTAAEMTMRHISAVVLPAGEAVTLEPGGLHVMLVGSRRTARVGFVVRSHADVRHRGARRR